MRGKIWHNGKLVPWENAQVHVLAHGLHYGSSVFEGIRAYKTPNGPMIFRLQPHLKRLFDSAKIYYMKVEYSVEDIAKACRETIAANNLEAAYIRPFFYRGLPELGLSPKLDVAVDVAVAAMQWGTYLGPEALEKGVDTVVSSWNRLAPNTIPVMAKAGGNYLSSQLISMEAKRLGYQEAIALDVHGYVSEGPGENIFLVRDGVISTPPLTASVLPGITRDTVMTLAEHAGYKVVERNISREALYLADELFFTGTAAEVTPIRSVDGILINDGTRGPVTEKVQKMFFGLFSGETEDRWGWLESASV